MRWMLGAALVAGSTVGCGAPPADAVEIGTIAPDFALPALDGTTHTLAQHRGKIVVLEWTNPGCPFVQDTHAPGGALDGLAAEEMAEGVVWFAINSGAPGKQGHGMDVNLQAAAAWNAKYPILLDETGKVGRAYSAKTSPHMFIVDADGKLVYNGAIDNQPMRQGSGDRVNFVAKALDDLRAGRPVQTPATKSYGCSVKY